MNAPRAITRRALLGAAGALVVAVPVVAATGPAAATATGDGPDAEGAVLAPTVFVRVDRRGRVVATVPRPDTGQGVRTMAAVLVAEELAVEVTDVVLEQAPGDTAAFGSQAVANSTSSRLLSGPLRTASATARCLLVAAAAARWGVPAAECAARRGRVEHPRHGSLPYRALVRAAAALDPGTVPVTLTPPERWRLIGRTGAGRADAHDIVTGRARFGAESAPAGGLVAVVARPPWIGALVDAVDDAGALAVPGVVAVVRLAPPGAGQGGVAIVAHSTAAALRGREALRVTWVAGSPAADSRAWLADLEAALPPVAGGTDVRRVYRLPLLAHAPMEPMNATAHVTGSGVTVWAPVQDPGGLRTQLARELALPDTRVRVNPTLAGGGFGRRIESDAVLEALACSRAVGQPVTVRWTREDDTRHDSYRPMSVHRLGATLGPDGVPVRRVHQVVTWPLTVVPPFGNPAVVLASGDHFPYAVPGEVSVTLRPAPLRTGFWRAVYAGQFGYAEECFLSEIAARGGHDQVDLRRRLLPADSRLRRVLDAAAERAGWSRGAGPGRGRGVACHLDYGSAIAVLVTADPAARRVLRVTAAVDVGVPVHPSGVIAQVEGGVLDAVSTVLRAQITVRDGAVVQSSFRDYAWARIGDCPDIEVVLVPSEAPIGGLGELAYPPAAAAVAAALAEGGEPVTGMPYGVAVG
ncbi:molybdopterin cofactor-binding domain-containing protein [Actinoplanes sp. NPDC049118]|uniref:xanthine dehydrogenase family protein molybdopterin-binding subunit n=1 Tax=Actinoplanes sp. NPDC049118 TaxID=3155769 RepID=UPI0033C50434